MLKKRNISVEDVMKNVAQENGFSYVPPEKRKLKAIIFDKDGSNDTKVKLVDRKSAPLHGTGIVDTLQGKGTHITFKTKPEDVNAHKGTKVYKIKTHKR